MAKEQFFYPATQPLFKKLEQLSQRSSVSRGQAFEDFLTAMVCVLAAETKEEDYMAMIERHRSGKPGQRGADLLAQMFGELVNAMTESDADILGDLFQGSITYGEAGQYFTPESVTKLMAELSVDPDARPVRDHPIYISDPACGTGRMLLEASNINPHAELVGQDIDARCVKITSVNLGLRGRYGWVICGNTLSRQTQFAYRIGSFFNESPHGTRRGVIRDVPPEEIPVPLIASRLRRDAQDLFEQSEANETPTLPPLPTIIEVPQWLARLEPTLAALDRSETMPPAEQQPIETRPARDANEPSKKQQDLF
jgi:hypothetical protein